MTVDFDSVECLSAFDIDHAQSIALDSRTMSVDSAPAIRLVALRNVLYLPSILDAGQSICLADRRIIPEESVLDCWSVDFFKESRRNNAVYQSRYADDFDVTFFDGQVCILGNLFSRNFGHWTEELLKVAILEESTRDFRYVIPTLPSFACEFLVLLGVEENRIVSVNSPTVFEEALFVTAISHANISSYPWALLRLRERLQSRLGQAPNRYGARLWLERGESLRTGGLTNNKEEVYRCIEDYDFDIVDMATLSVHDQLQTVGAAKTIAGPHGAQFVHAQFMPVSSTVIECFSPMHVNPSILQICRVLKHSYHQIVARSHLIVPYLHGRDCQVDCEHLRLVLDSL